MFRQADKHFVELNQNGASAWCFHSKPLPLAAIYLLGNRQPELAAASIEAISPQIGLMHLMTHRYPQSVKLERDRQERELAMLGRLVTKEIPSTTIQRTGIYTNHEKEQWEAWRVNQDTGERKLVDTCPFKHDFYAAFSFEPLSISNTKSL